MSISQKQIEAILKLPEMVAGSDLNIWGQMRMALN